MSSRPFIIVCGVDFSEASPLVVEHALAEAHQHPRAQVHFVTVLEKARAGTSELEEAAAQLRALVGETLPTFADDDPEASRLVRFHARAGKPEQEIVELAREARAERIILGRSARARSWRKLGGVSARVVEDAPCTVQVVQMPDYDNNGEDYSSCAECVRVRAESNGERWFCEEHSAGRSPRLMSQVGISHHTPGWGIF